MSRLVPVAVLFCLLPSSSCRDATAPAEEGRVEAGRSAGPGLGTVRVAGIVVKWIVADKERNFRRVEPMIREAAANGAKIVVTTEGFLEGYAVKDEEITLEDYRALGEPIPGGEYYKRLAALADELDIHLVAGVLEADAELRYNTAVLIGPDGRLVGKYRKQHLLFEHGRNTPGTEHPVFPTPYGDMGIMICADRRVESIPRQLTENGADFLICPSGGMYGPRGDRILQARSRENGRHIVFVHPAKFLVTGPRGEILSNTALMGGLVIAPETEGTETDRSAVFYFDLPRAVADG